MKDYIEERVKETADFIIKNNCTIRAAAKKFGVSKSTVHKDIVQRLEEINPKQAKVIRDILELNKEIRAVHGGEATRILYYNLRQVKL